MKLFKVKNKIIFLSRQSNGETLDFKLIKEEIRKRDSEVKMIFLCKRFDNIKKHLISYSLYTIKTLYHIATSKVCVVDSYSVVSMLKNRKDLKVLQIWHALGAIKKFSLQSVGTKAGRSEAVASALKMHKGYDAIISTSKASTKFFMEAFGYEKKYFKNYGLPRIDYLIHEESRLKKQILKKYKNLSKKTVILYAPTFRKSKVDSTEELIKNIDLNKYNLIVKGHLNQELKFDKSSIYTCDEFKALDLLTVCDYLITDYSAIAIEATVLNKKTLYYVYDYEEYKEENGLNVDLYKEMPGCVFKDVKDLVKTLENKYDDKLVKNYKDKYIENQEGNSAELIAKLIIDWKDSYEHKK